MYSSFLEPVQLFDCKNICVCEQIDLGRKKKTYRSGHLYVATNSKMSQTRCIDDDVLHRFISYRCVKGAESLCLSRHRKFWPHIIHSFTSVQKTERQTLHT